jgi:hypothetical protein
LASYLLCVAGILCSKDIEFVLRITIRSRLIVMQLFDLSSISFTGRSNGPSSVSSTVAVALWFLLFAG